MVENIFVDGVTMTDIKTYAMTFNMYYGGRSVAEVLSGEAKEAEQIPNVPVTEETPVFRNIDISNVVCNGAGYAMEFKGLPEMPIDGIHLKDIVIRAKNDATFQYSKNITKDNVNVIIE